ncbi:MAG: GTP cyclohydrolase FolE2 [Burkholderiales bacterium]|nr:GTP cyclohydrolase FolE2 [Burkholderiales bacterium]
MNSKQTILTHSSVIPDVQSEHDSRKLPIDRVGVKRLRYPIYFEDKFGAQPVVATCAADIMLVAEQKGTHMSRLVALFEEMSAVTQKKPLRVGGLQEWVTRLLDSLHAQNGAIELLFTLFMRKTAPISKIESTINYEVRLYAECKNGVYCEKVSVSVPVTSLCPCSKRISDYGAHNQRSVLTVSVVPKVPVFIADLVRVGEEEASSELFALLKRVDEKYVTEYAYDHPRFVEDLVRAMAQRLIDDPRFAGFSVEAENFESIHNHSAYAKIDFWQSL